MPIKNEEGCEKMKADLTPFGLMFVALIFSMKNNTEVKK